jgi:hypothetical protein
MRFRARQTGKLDRRAGFRPADHPLIAATGAAVLASNRGSGSFGASRHVTAPWRVRSPSPAVDSAITGAPMAAQTVSWWGYAPLRYGTAGGGEGRPPRPPARSRWSADSETSRQTRTRSSIWTMRRTGSRSWSSEPPCSRPVALLTETTPGQSHRFDCAPTDCNTLRANLAPKGTSVRRHHSCLCALRTSGRDVDAPHPHWLRRFSWCAIARSLRERFWGSQPSKAGQVTLSSRASRSAAG